MQTPPVVRVTERIKARLNLAVPHIGEQQKRFVEKNLLSLSLTDTMLARTLARVSSIPLKALASRQIDHILYMSHIYSLCQSPKPRAWKRGTGADMLAA